jgi:MFS transporter, DHA2 family, multidrug resistance protein
MTAQPNASLPPPTYSTAYRRAATATGLIGAFTLVLSSTVVNVAIPDVMGTFGVGQETAQFLSTAYITTMTASQLLAAWFIAVFGRRLSFSGLLTVFMVAGVICAVAPTIEVLIAGRVLQGFCSGVIQPLVMTTIVSLFPQEKRGAAIGLYIGGLSLALGFGPVVGGITIDTLGWRWIFVVPLPMVCLALLLGTFFVPEDAGPRTRTPFDWWGYGLLCITLYCVMNGVAGGNREGWDSDLILSYWLIAAIASTAFIVLQRGREHPLLDFTILADPRFASAIALVVVFGLGNFALTYSIPVFGQLVMNLTPTAAGLMLLPAGLAASAATLIVGQLIDRVSPVITIVFGLLLSAYGAHLLSKGDPNTAFVTLLMIGVICRVGTSCVGPSITATALRALPPSDINKASGTINFFRQMGGAFGINAMVAVVQWRTSVHGQSLAATQTAANQSTGAFVDAASEMLNHSGLTEPIRDQLAWRFLSETVGAQSAAFAWRDGFTALMVVTLLAIIPAWRLGRAQRRAQMTADT